jgi:hypothetical protein
VPAPLRPPPVHRCRSRPKRREEHPGALPFDYFTAAHPGWLAVPEEARPVFPAIDEIMRQRIVRRRIS